MPILISLMDARRGLKEKCKELFKDERIAGDIYWYLCEGIDGCDAMNSTFSEWIPVTERLPEDDYAKLVYEADNENKFLAIYEDGRWKSFDPNDYNETYFDETDYGNIVAWMELPEDYEYPPKDFMNPPEGSEE